MTKAETKHVIRADASKPRDGAELSKIPGPWFEENQEVMQNGLTVTIEGIEFYLKLLSLGTTSGTQKMWFFTLPDPTLSIYESPQTYKLNREKTMQIIQEIASALSDFAPIGIEQIVDASGRFAGVIVSSTTNKYGTH